MPFLSSSCSCAPRRRRRRRRRRAPRPTDRLREGLRYVTRTDAIPSIARCALVPREATTRELARARLWLTGKVCSAKVPARELLLRVQVAAQIRVGNVSLYMYL